jgi:hypothetical protein
MLFKAVWEAFCEGNWEIEVNDLITITALSCGIVEIVPFDADEHSDHSGACEPGDDYFQLTDAGRALLKGPDQ